MPNIAGKVQQNYVIQRQQTQNFDDFDVRGDWNATQGDRLFARASYAHDKEDTSTRLPGLPAGYGSGSQFTYAHGGALGYTHTFTPALFSDLRLGFQRTNLGYLPPYSDVPLSKNMGIPNANTSSLLGGGALIGGYNSQLEYTGDYGNYQVPENTFQGAGSLSWAKGNHLFKFGGNFIRREVNLFRPKAGKGYFFLWGNGVGPGSTGYETADVLAGFVQNYQIGAQTGMFGTRSWENAIFVQDDWRISRRLTLNLGVRYDVLTNPTEVAGRQSNFDLQTASIRVASGNRDPLVNNNYHNIGPRFGFAYDVTGKGQTVVRGGFGMFYFLDRGGIDNQLSQNAPFSGISQYNYNDGYRITLSGQAPTNSANWMAATGALPAAGFTGLSLTNPQNISVAAIKTGQPDFHDGAMEPTGPASVAAERGGKRGLCWRCRAPPGRVATTSPTSSSTLPPARISIREWAVSMSQDARGNSIYHSLQAEASRRFSNGLQFTASYTFSKTIDQGSGAFATEQIYQSLRLDRALADTDVRNRFVFSGVYELPLGHGKRFANQSE